MNRQVCASLDERERAIRNVKGYGIRKGKNDVLPLVNETLSNVSPLNSACTTAMVVYRSREGGVGVQWQGKVVFYALGSRIKTAIDIMAWFEHLERLAQVTSDEQNFS